MRARSPGARKAWPRFGQDNDAPAAHGFSGADRTPLSAARG